MVTYINNSLFIVLFERHCGNVTNNIRGFVGCILHLLGVL